MIQKHCSLSTGTDYSDYSEEDRIENKEKETKKANGEQVRKYLTKPTASYSGTKKKNKSKDNTDLRLQVLRKRHQKSSKHLFQFILIYIKY